MAGQYKVVTQDAPAKHQALGELALFDAEGNPVQIGGGEPAPVTWAEVSNKPATVAALPAAVGSAGQVLKAGAGGSVSWGTDASTPAPAAGTLALLNAGTDTTQRTWSAKDIADYVAAKIAAAQPAG